jgi:hypothetical protein
VTLQTLFLRSSTSKPTFTQVQNQIDLPAVPMELSTIAGEL